LLLALASTVIFGSSPVGLVNTFYCPRFVTSLFVASYDSQGYGGGLRPRLHTGFETHSQLTLLITSWLEPCRKHRSSVAVQLLFSDGMTYSIVACAAIGTECGENIIPLLLFSGRCLATAGCCDSTILALSEFSVKLLRLRKWVTLISEIQISNFIFHYTGITEWPVIILRAG
jgi:hypothetical protein